MIEPINEDLGKEEEPVIEAEPQMFLMRNLDRVFVSIGTSYDMLSEENRRADFEWSVPKPREGETYGLIVRPTAKQKAIGCVCPGLRHIPSNPGCEADGKSINRVDMSKFNHPDPNMLYTTSYQALIPLNIIEDQGGIRRRIRLVTYNKEAFDGAIRRRGYFSQN